MCVCVADSREAGFSVHMSVQMRATRAEGYDLIESPDIYTYHHTHTHQHTPIKMQPLTPHVPFIIFTIILINLVLIKATL